MNRTQTQTQTKPPPPATPINRTLNDPFVEGPRRHPREWFTANAKAVAAARAAGLDPERHPTAIANIVLSVLDTVLPTPTAR